MNSKRIHVLFLNDHLGHADGLVHGVGTYFLNIVPRIDSAHIALTVCFLRGRHPLAEQLEANGVHPVFLCRAKWDPRALWDLIHLIQKHEIQIVHAAGMKGILLGRAAARLTGCRVVIHLHDTERPGPGMRMLQRLGAPWTDVALGVSNAVCDLAREEFGIPAARVQVLHNAVDISSFAHANTAARSRLRTELQIPSGAPVIGLIGRFHPVKGHRLLIGALPSLLGCCPEAVLVCVGDGPTRHGCQALAAELGLMHAVRFTGQRSDIPDVLAALDVLAMPSLKEGLGFVAIEAMAAGKPVVGFNVGGIPEVVVHGQTGLLVPSGDITAFVKALDRVLSCSQLALQLSSGGRRHADEFSIDRHVARLGDIYRSLAVQPATTTISSRSLRRSRVQP